MRHSLIIALSIIVPCKALAQYGTVDPKAVATAKTETLLVVLDDGDSPYNRAVMEAVKAHWNFSAGYDIIHAHDLAVAPVAADKLYLMKTTLVDPVKYEMTFMTLVQGWKQKKGETLQTKDNAFININGEQILAQIQCDPAWLADHDAAAMYAIYVKNLQDYLGLVAAGTIIDKATADRTYAGRNRVIKDRLQLWVAKPHLDKSLANADAVKTNYSHMVQVIDLSQVMEAVAQQDNTVSVTDVIITGANEKKHCFKRIFNCNTGELQYLRDDAALYGKKEGFIADDFIQIERSR